MGAISEILNEITHYGPGIDGDYYKRMMHPVPRTTVIEREAWILEHCKGKIVLDIGCSGQLHKLIEQVAQQAWGIDRVECDVPNFIHVNVESECLPIFEKLDLIVCGEVLEHLSNPGIFLDKLHKYNCDIIFTVPNAFTFIGRDHILTGTENVNDEHVCYYSYKTFKTLIERHKFELLEFYWYHGPEYVSEGLCFLVRARG